MKNTSKDKQTKNKIVRLIKGNYGANLKDLSVQFKKPIDWVRDVVLTEIGMDGLEKLSNTQSDPEQHKEFQERFAGKKETAISMARDGASRDEIMEVTGFSACVLYSIGKALMNKKRITRSTFNIAFTKSRMNVEQVRQYSELFNQGVTMNEIAKLKKCSFSTVRYNINNGVTLGYVKPEDYLDYCATSWERRSNAVTSQEKELIKQLVSKKVPFKSISDVTGRAINTIKNCVEMQS